MTELPGDMKPYRDEWLRLKGFLSEPKTNLQFDHYDWDADVLSKPCSARSYKLGDVVLGGFNATEWHRHLHLLQMAEGYGLVHREADGITATYSLTEAGKQL